MSVTRGEPLLRILGEAAEDLLDLVDAEPGGHVEHDLLAHRLRARLVAGLGDAAGPHLPERQAEGIEVILHRSAAGGFLLLRGGELRLSDHVGAERQHFVRQTGVDCPGRDGIEIDRPSAQFLGEGFDEAHHPGLGRGIGGEIGAGLGRTATGKRHDLRRAFRVRVSRHAMRTATPISTCSVIADRSI